MSDHRPPHTAPPNTSPWLPLLLFAALLTLATGCKTVGGDSGSGKDLAAVSLKADSFQQVKQATLEVFFQKGYALDFDSTKQLVFSKRASTGSTILFGGWPGIDPPIEDRVQIYVEDSGTGDFTLHCDAYVVSDAGQGFFEEKRPVYKTRASAYRKLLEEVKKKIPQPPPTPTTSASPGVSAEAIPAR